MVSEREREMGRYANKMRKLGTPLMVTPAEFAAAVRLLEKAQRYGMSDQMIADQCGVPGSLATKARRGKIKTMHRNSFNRLMTLRPERPKVFATERRGKVGGGTYVDPTGTVRRLQALRADGFPGRILGERLGVSYEAVAQLAKSDRANVYESTRLEVARLYSDLEDKVPADFGVKVYAIGKCATLARRAGYAPRSCWDSDTIDDPAAEPEWTGRCGTWWGWHAHRRDGIPMCPRCEPFAGREIYPGFDGRLLRELRERKGFTRKQLAGQVEGVNASTVQYWEVGRNRPARQGKLDRILVALDATLEDVCHE